RFNGVHNLTDDQGVIISQSELEERLRYMTEIVFPAIEAKAKSTQQKMIERFNRTILHNEFPDGAKVMVLDPIRSDKLSPRYEGPYVVHRRNTGGAYELRDGTGEPLGRNYAPSQLKLVLDDLDDDIHVVEEIVAHRSALKGKGVEYYVKWEGFPSEANTWQPESSFIERKCISDYWDRYPNGDAQTRSQSHQPPLNTKQSQQQHKQPVTHKNSKKTKQSNQNNAKQSNQNNASQATDANNAPKRTLRSNRV
ncbi:hypothetical protein BGX20_005206, partial [Mortierella sp. AD010]